MSEIFQVDWKLTNFQCVRKKRDRSHITTHNTTDNSDGSFFCLGNPYENIVLHNMLLLDEKTLAVDSTETRQYFNRRIWALQLHRVIRLTTDCSLILTLRQITSCSRTSPWIFWNIHMMHLLHIN